MKRKRDFRIEFNENCQLDEDVGDDYTYDLLYDVGRVMGVMEHRHERILTVLHRIPFGGNAHMPHIKNPVVCAWRLGCLECVKMCIDHGMSGHTAAATIRRTRIFPNMTPKQMECYEYVEKQLPMHPLNLKYLLPLLVTFSSQGESSVIESIKKHSLYTRDVLRAVMKLAIVTKREMRSI
jgi:hypothetical protein